MSIFYKFTDRTAMLAAVSVDDGEGGVLVPAYMDGAALSEIGLAVDTPAVVDDDGNVTTPVTYKDGWWLMASGEVAALSDHQETEDAPNRGFCYKGSEKSILKELKELDRYIPRALEDLMDSGVFKKVDLSTYNQERFDRKKELREKLK